MALSEYTCVRKLCLAPRHSGRDAFSRAIIFLLRSVTKYYSLTLKITASVLHGLRKCVRELMVSDNRWLTLHWGVHLRSWGSSGVAALIVVRPGGRRVRPWSLGSLWCALEVDRFVWCRWVNWGVLWGSSGSFGLAGFIWMRPWGRRIRQGSLGSLSSSSSEVSGFIGVRPRRRQVYQGSLG